VPAAVKGPLITFEYSSDEDMMAPPKGGKKGSMMATQKGHSNITLTNKRKHQAVPESKDRQEQIAGKGS